MAILKILHILLVNGIKNGWPIISTLVLSSIQSIYEVQLLQLYLYLKRSMKYNSYFKIIYLLTIYSCPSQVYIKWIKVNGLKYSTQNCYLIASTDSDHHPTFSKIEKIFLLEENMKVYFVASECTATSYDNQLLAFSFINTSQYLLLSNENLQYPWPLNKRKVLFDNSDNLTIFLSLQLNNNITLTTYKELL